MSHQVVKSFGIKYINSDYPINMCHSFQFGQLLDYFKRWKFHSSNGDVSFGVYHKNEDFTSTPVLAPGRVDSGIVSIQGEIQCHEPGLCK